MHASMHSKYINVLNSELIRKRRNWRKILKQNIYYRLINRYTVEMLWGTNWIIEKFTSKLRYPETIVLRQSLLDKRMIRA